MTAAWAMCCGCRARIDNSMLTMGGPEPPIRVTSRYRISCPGWPGQARPWRIFIPARRGGQNKRQDDTQHTRRGPARQRQEGINRLRHGRRMVLHPAFEGIQAVLVENAPDGAQAAHHQFAAAFQRRHRVRAQQHQGDDDQDQAYQAHQHGHGGQIARARACHKHGRRHARLTGQRKSRPLARHRLSSLR